MKKRIIVLTTTLSLVALIALTVQAKVISNAIWADGQLFGVTITPKDVPQNGPFDVLYNFDESGLTGQRSVSETKPGDTDYNGGRWEVLPVTFTPEGILVFDPDGDGEVNSELTSDQEVQENAGLGYLVIGSPVRYFVCPLHPQNKPEQ